MKKLRGTKNKPRKNAEKKNRKKYITRRIANLIIPKQ